jgi:hypothetical protein
VDKYKEIENSPFAIIQPGSRTFIKGDCLVVLSPPSEKFGWHISVSCQHRNPRWSEIKQAWYDLVPDSKNKNGAMFFPPVNEYVNLHKHCFHIHEVPLDLKVCMKVSS